MHPVHDADVLLMLCITQAAKRRPAPLEEIITAGFMLQTLLPAEPKIVDAFARLGTAGLVEAHGDGYTLSKAAQALMAKIPAKAQRTERAALTKESLQAYEAPEPALPAIDIPVDLMFETIAATRKANPRLAPDPLEGKKPPRNYKAKTPYRPGQRRTPRDDE